MAFTGWSVGTLFTNTQGDSTSIPIVIQNIRYMSSTGGSGAVACIREKGNDGATFFRGVVGVSYGMSPASYADGKMVRGIVVTSLSEGYIEIDLR